MEQEIKTEEESQEMEEPQNKKANTLPVIGVIVALIAVTGVIVAKNIKLGGSSTSPTNMTPLSTTTSTSALPDVKEFTVDGISFEFDPKTITVNKGDTIKINFKDNDGMHNLVVDGYNVKTDTIKSGLTASVTFLADKAGSFEYYCSVGSHKEKGMTGTLTVK